MPFSSTRVHPVLIGFFVLLLTGCSFGGQSAQAPGRASDVITLEEIEAAEVPTAYDVVARLRPNWLRGRGSPTLRSGPVLPVVYVAGVRQGNVDTLRNVSRTGVVRLRFIDATTATTRWGSGHSGGVIEVTVRRR